MIKKSTLTLAFLAAALSMPKSDVKAQDVHFTQFNSTPLILNPAFTGNFNGKLRVAGAYRDQWSSITPNSFKTMAVSVDAPLIHDLSIDDYLAGGLQVYRDVAGDLNLANTSILASLAYHKFLGADANKALSVGFQGGYTSKSMDLSKAYFGDQYLNGGWAGPSMEDGTSTGINYMTVNAGIGWAHSASEKFAYTIGVGANNLNQPRDAFKEKQNKEVGLGMRYTAQLGAIIYTGDRFSIRPSALYQMQSKTDEIVVGAEFHQIFGNPEFRSIANAFFLGGYYRLGDAYLFNAGVEIKGLRIGASYDFNVSDLKSATNNRGGFEVALRYILPNPLDFARKLEYPCARF